MERELETTGFIDRREAERNTLADILLRYEQEVTPQKKSAAMETIKIKVDKIRDVIGSGGKVVKKIIDETGVDIDIHEDGNIFITSNDAEGMKKAKQMIEDIVREVEVGEIYTGRVTRLMKFGAFVEVLLGKEGLCHISQLANHRVEKVEDVVQVGDQLQVKVVEIDDKGRINLSHKAVL